MDSITYKYKDSIGNYGSRGVDTEAGDLYLRLEESAYPVLSLPLHRDLRDRLTNSIDISGLHLLSAIGRRISSQLSGKRSS